jgi:hypothetical protein
MKTIFHNILILILLCIAQAFASPIKVFILSGQSNMSGFGRIMDIASNDSFIGYREMYPMIKFFLASDGGELTYSDSLKPGASGYQDVGGISGNNTFGPELGIAKMLSNKFPNDSMAFLKIPWGGTILEPNWLNDQPFPGASIHVYSWFISKLKEALNRLSQSPQGYEIQGIIWMQGEGDATDSGMAARYSKNLHDFVESKLRPDLGQYPAHLINGVVPFIYGRIHNQKTPLSPSDNSAFVKQWPFGDCVQQQQLLAQNEIPCVRCSDTSLIATVWPLGLPDAPFGFGSPHYNTQGALRVGEGLGKAMVDILSGKKDLGCRDSISGIAPNIGNASDSQARKKATPINNTVELQTRENPLSMYALFFVSFPEVKSTSARLTLLALNGTQARDIRLYKGQNRLTISRRFLPSGCYIVRFKDGDKIGIKKMFWKCSNAAR